MYSAQWQLKLACGDLAHLKQACYHERKTLQRTTNLSLRYQSTDQQWKQGILVTVNVLVKHWKLNCFGTSELWEMSDAELRQHFTRSLDSQIKGGVYSYFCRSKAHLCLTNFTRVFPANANTVNQTFHSHSHTHKNNTCIPSRIYLYNL